MIALLALTITVQQSDPVIAIENVSVIHPGESVARAGYTVLIQRETFIKVDKANKVRIPKDAQRIDGTGKYLIPGLWDMHTHWYEESALGLFTANGVTGVRIMFGTPRHLSWRARIEQQELIGPRMVVGSPIIDGEKPIWPGSIPFAENGDAKVLVARLKSESWDFVKSYDLLTRKAFFALVLESKKQGIPIAGHVPIAVSPLEAAKAGLRSMEHLEGLREASMVGEPEYRKLVEQAMKTDVALSHSFQGIFEKLGPEKSKFSEQRSQKLFTDLGKTKMWQCPTLVTSRALSSLDDPAFLADDRLKYMSDSIRKQWDPANDFRLKDRTEEDWNYWKRDYRAKLGFVRKLKDSGNRILAGTDSLNPYCFPGFSLHDELALLVEAGLTPTEALETATVNPARFFEEDHKWGTIAKGKRADAVLLDKNPLENIRNTTQIRMVIQSGRVFPRSELDQILESNIR